jgi:hypothetical protein
MDSGCDLLSAVARLAGTGGIDFISKNYDYRRDDRQANKFE